MNTNDAETKAGFIRVTSESHESYWIRASDIVAIRSRLSGGSLLGTGSLSTEVVCESPDAVLALVEKAKGPDPVFTEMLLKTLREDKP